LERSGSLGRRRILRTPLLQGKVRDAHVSVSLQVLP
jgi:hypothetical protein